MWRPPGDPRRVAGPARPSPTTGGRSQGELTGLMLMRAVLQPIAASRAAAQRS
jgi:hypothetical protein